MAEQVERVLNRLTEVTGHQPQKTGDRFMSLCPAHADRNPSLSIRELPDGKVVLHCFAGCCLDAILAKLGIEKRELFPKGKSGQAHATRKSVSAVYPYVDEQDTLLFEVVRFIPKDFRQRHPGPDGKPVSNMQGVRRVLFRLPQLIAAVKGGRTIFVAEGEKDVLTLVEKFGVEATCNVGGAGKWCNEYSDFLVGADVVIFADKDTPGRAHAKAGR